jgi:serine/threonine protein kinase
MIGENGYPKIIDFGLAKQLPYMKLDNGIMTRFSRCYTLCGTPEYVAPELIIGKSYDYGIDIWAFGVLLYEMICRYTPFTDGNKKKDIERVDCITNIFKNIIMCGKNGIEISHKVDKKADGTPNARNLITQLLNGNIESRLGKNNTPKNLLSTPYFLSTGINVDELYNQTIEAPNIQPQYIGRDIETAPQIEEYDDDQDIFTPFNLSIADLYNLNR